jgi:hypothetical protein
MISLVPSHIPVTKPLSQDVFTVPSDFMGIHANNWPISQRPYITGKTGSGTIGLFTVTMNNVTGLPIGANIVTFDAMGTAVGAKITAINGLVLTLDLANIGTFSSKTMEFYYPGAVEAVATPDPSPTNLDYTWFRTHDSQWGQWRQHNPAPGFYNWTNTDAIYKQLMVEKKKILVTILGTPKFASARPMEFWSAYGHYGGAAEPANMQYLADYCVELAKRYPLINHFEVWNEPKFIAVPTKITTSSGVASVTLAEVLNVAATGTIGVNTITLASGNSLLVEIGGAAIGTGIAANATVTARNGTLITLSAVNAGAVSGNISFRSTATGLVTGGMLMSSSVPVGTSITSVAADKITVNLNQSATSTGTVSASFHGVPTSFYSGSYAKLAEMTRIVSQAIKSVNPNAKIMCAGQSNIMSNPAWVEDSLVTSDGTTTTIYRTNLPVKTGESIQITNAGVYNTPTGTYDIVTSTAFGSCTILRTTPAGSGRCNFMFRFSVNEGILSASATGYSYLGNDGTGTRAIDWIDIFACHTYLAQTNAEGNSVFSDTQVYRKYLKELGKPNIEMWSTEYGMSFNEDVTGAAVTAGGSTVTITGSVATDRLKGQHLLDGSGNFVGLITTNAGASATLASPALLTISGTNFMIRTTAERVAITQKYIKANVAAGYAKTFIYSWGTGALGLPMDDASIVQINETIASVKGKKIAGVKGSFNGGPIDILVI